MKLQFYRDTNILMPAKFLFDAQSKLLDRELGIMHFTSLIKYGS